MPHRRLPRRLRRPPARPSPDLPIRDAKRVDVVDNQFGVQVADPYRWLENDVRNDPEVEAWVDGGKPGHRPLPRDPSAPRAFKERMTAALRLRAVRRAGEEGRPLFLHPQHAASRTSRCCSSATASTGEGASLIDPNGWSADGATALAEWTPSEDGKLLAYSIQDGGTDWRTVKVIDVATGKILPDEIKWLKYAGDVSWAKDGKRLLLLALPGACGGPDLPERDAQPPRLFPQARHAAVGRPAGLCDARPIPSSAITREVSDDGRWLVISTSRGGRRE